MTNIGGRNITLDTLRTDALELPPVSNVESIYIATFSAAVNNSLFSEPDKVKNSTATARPRKTHYINKKAKWFDNFSIDAVIEDLVIDYIGLSNFVDDLSAALPTPSIDLEEIPN